MRYEIIKAKSVEEAIALSQFKVGEIARCDKQFASANGDGTYTVNSEFEAIPQMTSK